MNAIRINPFVFLTPNAIQSSKDAVVLAQDLFTELPIEKGIQWIYKALSHAPAPGFGAAQPVDTFEAAYFDSMNNEVARSGDVMYVDENGLYNNHNDCWIVIRGAWQPFAGAGLIVGTTPSGDSRAPKKVTLDWLKENVIILCQSMIYVPRVERVGFATFGTAAHFAIKTNLCNRDNPFWTDPNVLTGA